MAAGILTCICKHDFQDKRYGKNKRVHTSIKNGTMWRCTVCKSEKSK